MKSRWMFATASSSWHSPRRPAFAQSSGSFNFNADTTACTDIAGLLVAGPPSSSINTTMKVSSGSGVALVVRPSPSPAADERVALGASWATRSAPARPRRRMPSGQPAPQVTPGGPVTYDDRFTQISTNLFGTAQRLTDCPCTFDLNQVTLSRTASTRGDGPALGEYGVTVSWTRAPTSRHPTERSPAWGRWWVTTEQVKIFNQRHGYLVLTVGFGTQWPPRAEAAYAIAAHVLR